MMRFSAAIAAQPAVIPDIKCVSPKEGDLLRGRDPVEVARQLVAWGAPVLSVVTESRHFGGSPELLRAIARQTGAPVLRKDFIKTRGQLEETLALGASAVLLIAAGVDEATLAALYQTALQLGLEPLVEVCTAEEMQLASTLGARLVGINNRNIQTLELDDGGPARTAQLAQLAPKHAVLISESGIVTAEDAKIAMQAGAHAILVGTVLWQAADMKETYQRLREAIA